MVRFLALHMCLSPSVGDAQGSLTVSTHCLERWVPFVLSDLHLIGVLVNASRIIACLPYQPVFTVESVIFLALGA